MKSPVDLTALRPAPSVAGRSPVFAQCMLRIRDPAASRAFYEGKLGMTFLTQLDFPDLSFSLHFYAYPGASVVPDMSGASRSERAAWLFSLPYATLELTHNWGSDEAYVNGNTDPGRGFGHVGVVVDDAPAAVARLAASGVPVVREAKPFADVGTIAFVADPDGYWCEVIERPPGAKVGGAERGMVGPAPVFAQVMLRVTDPRRSIQFFQALGMKLVARLDFPENEFSLFFMAYTELPGAAEGTTRAEVAEWLWKFRECTVELTHNWVGDVDAPPVYVNGNEKPYRGFGHVGVLVDDVEATTNAMAAAGYSVVRQPGPFKDLGVISFVASPKPEKYWVELIAKRQ